MKVDEAEMAEVMDVEAFKDRLDAIVSRLRDNYIKQFSVRTSIGELTAGTDRARGEKRGAKPTEIGLSVVRCLLVATR